MRVTAVLTVRNEAPFLVEWLAHHQAVGITDFVVLSNDCDDGTDALLDRLAELGHLAHVRNPGPHEGGVQWAALKRADGHPLVQEADWLVALDIDEFINVHVGDKTLSALLEALPQATAITLTWRLFGNDGVVRFEDRPLTEQFVRAAPAVLAWPWRAAMFKTLYRNDGTYRKLGVHRPRSPDPALVDHASWYDGSGRDLGPRFRRQQIFSPFGRDNYALVQLNHYPLGSMESYVVKCDRGRAVHDGDSLGMSYWVERNWCVDEDRSILALADARAERASVLMADPEVARLHKAGVEWRRERFESLMMLEANRALFGRLMMTPPARPVDDDGARLLYRYAQMGNRHRH